MDHCKTQEEQRWFDEHELMGDDDDDISYLEEYLIQKDHPYYVNEEEERSKERRCELLGVPYIKPPTCKTKKFEVVKYSFGPEEEYVAITENEYDIWSCWYSDAFTTHILAHKHNMEDHIEQLQGVSRSNYVGIKSLLNAASITAVHIRVNYKVNDVEGVNAASEEISTAELLSEFELWRMRIEQYIHMIDYVLWEVIENGATLPKTQVVEGVTTVIPITSAKDKSLRRLEVKARSTLMMSIPNEHYSNEAVNAAYRVTTASTQVNIAYSTNIDNLSDAVICSFFASQPNSHQLVHEDLQQIYPDDIEEMDLRWQMAMLTMRARSSRRSVHVETCTSIALVSCDGLGGYDWSDQAEEGPNYALMAYSSSSSDSDVSNDSNCSKSYMETVKLLKSQNYQLLRDLEKYSLMVLVYKTGEITISELRKKLEKIPKEKDSIQFNVDKFENAAKSLNKLIECQIVDNCKKGLGYEKYNAFPPPYTGNFMPQTPDLSFTSLDEFVNKPVLENYKAMFSEEEPKVVRKNDDAPIIEEWMSDDEEEDVSQHKIEKKTVRPSIIKKEFVKSKQQEKSTRKTVKQVEQHRQNTYSPRGNQRNWNNMMSQKLGSNFEMFNKVFDIRSCDANFDSKEAISSKTNLFRL
ncbi:hypothetical protein Tco_0696215 [Tanacetum coccineum]